MSWFSFRARIGLRKLLRLPTQRDFILPILPGERTPFVQPRGREGLANPHPGKIFTDLKRKAKSRMVPLFSGTEG